VNAAYVYPGGTSVGPATFEVARGELVALAGASGSGKSTLLRLVAGTLARSGLGTISGSVAVLGENPSHWPPRLRPARLGLVPQEPADAVIESDVRREVALAPAWCGLAPGEALEAADRALARAGASHLRERDIRALSGGELQRVVLAAAMAGGAPVLVLDEPLAHLDPGGVSAIVGVLRELADSGTAVLVAEHRLAALGGVADRVIEIEGGRVARLLPGDVGALRAAGLVHPVADEVSPVAAAGPAIAGAKDVHVDPGLRGVSIDVCAGERVALLGPNGAGKSTLLRVLAREQRPRAGTVDGVPGLYVPQEPDLSLFCESVEAEIAYAGTEARRPAALEDARALAERVGLGHLVDRAPPSLSRGERLRLAVASAIAAEPRLLLLDEPTSGQDRASVERVFADLRARPAGTALVFATHDLDLARRHATRAMAMDAGRRVIT
jgi:energy-coupling factor transport system ATP-binding protein